jgi:hypothetical protein
VQLTSPRPPELRRIPLERRRFDRWATASGHTTKMHDPLSPSVALGLGFVSIEQRRVVVTAPDRLSRDPVGGRLVQVTTGADLQSAENLRIHDLADQATHRPGPRWPAGNASVAARGRYSLTAPKIAAPRSYVHRTPSRMLERKPLHRRGFLTVTGRWCTQPGTGALDTSETRAGPGPTDMADPLTWGAV